MVTGIALGQVNISCSYKNVTITFNTDSIIPAFIDSRDGNVYDTITVGTTVWMNRNFAYHSTGSVSVDLNSVNDLKYGRLYLRSILSDSTFCPVGWHIATITEWNSLITYTGGQLISGQKLRSSTDWIDDITYPGMDTIGFNLKGAGYNAGGQAEFNQRTYLWCADPLNNTDRLDTGTKKRVQ